MLTFLISDKPKLFLIQACRGNALQEMADGSDSPNSMQDEILERRSCVQSRNPESEEQLYTDSEDRPKLPKDADIIVAYATTSGKFIIPLKEEDNSDTYVCPPTRSSKVIPSLLKSNTMYMT